MSSRAIRKLRGNNLIPTIPDSNEDDEDDEHDDHQEVSQKKNRSAFAAVFEDDYDDDESSSSESSSSAASEPANVDKATAAASGDQGTKQAEQQQQPPQLIDGADGGERKPPTSHNERDDEEEKDDEEEDLDALLNEFQIKDEEQVIGKSKEQQPNNHDGCTTTRPTNFPVILEGMDVRDMDVDYTMRTSLLGSSGSGNNDNNTAGTNKNKNRRSGGGGGRQQFLFGPSRDNWPRPPHYVGGGMGMTTYDRVDEPRKLSWPYYTTTNDTASDRASSSASSTAGVVVEQGLTNNDRWYTFTHSDSYEKVHQDYKQIKDIGDINALILFVAHHPYATDALLQLSTVLYQTNRSNEGLALLRRCLWVYEMSALKNFVKDVLQLSDYDSSSTADGNPAGGAVFVDSDQPENAAFFKALFFLAQVSNIAGLQRTSFALSRFILSMDPLRDPLGVLLNLDHYALACNSESADIWIINLVDSDQIRIWYRDDDGDGEGGEGEITHRSQVYNCKLCEMPNWAFSYALALFRTSEDSTEPEAKEKADEALRTALSMFPSVVGMLLQDNDIDTSGRSFRRDWIKVLDYASNSANKLQSTWMSSSTVDPVVMSATLQALDLCIRIFVRQNARLWSDDRTLQWLYDNLEALMHLQSSDDGTSQDNGSTRATGPPAIMRYIKINPADYDNKIQQLPQDFNIVDPNLVAQAMVVDPNRRRFLRGNNNQRGAFGNFQGDEGEGGRGGDNAWLPAVRPGFLGPPTQTVNPDWPLLEVFWRSILPWNRVEGV